MAIEYVGPQFFSFMTSKMKWIHQTGTANNQKSICVKS